MKGISIIIVLLFCTVFLSACNVGRNGTHTGYVTAIQNEGIIFRKDYVFIKTDKSSSQEDKYCVDAGNDELVSELRKTEENGEKVTLRYNTRLTILGWFACAGDYIISFSK